MPAEEDRICSMTRDYADSVVVVTGAAGGLGRAIAIGAAERGARAVVINDLVGQDGAAETAELVKAAGATPILALGDVGDLANCEAIASAAKAFGVIDALFNNAAKTVPGGDHSRLDTEADDFIDVFRVNLIGPYQMIRACKPLLDKSSRAAIVNISSIAALTGLGTSLPYVASKGALISVTLSLARALAPTIRVNSLCPGHIDTPWFGRLYDENQVEAIRQSFRQGNALNAVSMAEDIAGPALFLGSTDARHLTGEVLRVDAGLHLNSGLPKKG